MKGLWRSADPLSADWISLLLLACLLALALVNAGSPRKWRVLRQATWRMRMGTQALREDLDLRDRSTLGLLLMACVSTGLFLWQAGVWRGIHMPSLPWLAGGFIVLLLAHAFLLRLTSMLALTDGGTVEFLQSGVMLFAATGILLLPVSALIAYQPSWRSGLVALGLIVVATMLLYRWVRGVWIGLGHGASFGYIFVYLCAAEIMPLLLALHALQRTIPPTSHH